MAGLIHELELPLPGLAAAAKGLRIAHLSDLHVTRPGRLRYRRLMHALDRLEADLAVLTGDYMCERGDEAAAASVMGAVCERLRPRLGVFGVFGNHDSHELRRRLAALPVQWLTNRAVTLDDAGVQLLGFEATRYATSDAPALAASMHHRNGSGHPPREHKSPTPPQPRLLRLLLSHYPTMLPIASDLGVDVMFSGHTHGGQWRLPGRVALYTSCDLPGRLAAGVLRHRDTLAVISRGLGETWVPIRFFCRAHLPVYTLVPGELPGRRTAHVHNAIPW